MAWAGTVMTPLAVRTLMAPAGPLTSGPHQAWPLVPVTATAAGAGRWPPARKRGDHRQDQSHNGEPDPGTQPGSGARTQGAAALSGVTDGVSDPADSEDRQRSGRQRGDGQRRGQPLDRARGRAAGGAQDAADADETQHGHLDGVPAAGGSGKLFQPIRGRGGRAGRPQLHLAPYACFLPGSQAVLHGLLRASPLRLVTSAICGVPGLATAVPGIQNRAGRAGSPGPEGAGWRGIRGLGAGPGLACVPWRAGSYIRHRCPDPPPVTTAVLAVGPRSSPEAGLAPVPCVTSSTPRRTSKPGPAPKPLMPRHSGPRGPGSDRPARFWIPGTAVARPGTPQMADVTSREGPGLQESVKNGLATG